MTKGEKTTMRQVGETETQKITLHIATHNRERFHQSSTSREASGLCPTSGTPTLGICTKKTSL